MSHKLPFQIKEVDIHFNTAAPSIFGVKKYADELMKLVVARDINFSKESNLVSINTELGKFYKKRCWARRML